MARMVEFETTDTDTHMDIYGYLEDYVRDSDGRLRDNRHRHNMDIYGYLEE